jgi:hypothetical protein
VSLLLRALLVLSLAGGAPEVLARHGKSRRGTIDGRPYLVLRGTHRERGLDHGVLAGKEIVRVLSEGMLPLLGARWERDFAGAVGRFVWPERFEEELAGMLEGIRKAVPAAERRIGPLGREVGLADLKALNALSDLLGTGCSSFAAWGGRTADGKPIVGRNLDYAAFPVGFAQCVVGVEPAEQDLRPTLGLSMFGLLEAGTTLNRDGVFVALHDEAGLPAARTEGWIPRFLALRSAVERAGTPDEVVERLRGSPVRVGNNILAAGATALVAEWDGHAKDGGATRRAAAGESIVCTNHYLSRAARGGGESGGRYASLAGAIGEDRKIGLDEARAMLARVSKSGANVTHLSAIVWPQSRRLAFAFSPGNGRSAAEGRWTELGWDDVFKN